LTQLDSALGRHPEHWGLHASRGLALAGLGREADARKEAEWLTTSQEYRDLYGRGNIFEARAMIFAQLGLAQEAVTELEPVLDGPSRVSAPLIGLDPRYDPIRQDPRFQRLLRKYANPQPVR
jgi:serine/threonine-protein kinase